MKRFIRSKKAMAATGLAAGLAFSAGIAAAVGFTWTGTNSTGSGTAKAQSLTFNVTAVSSPTASDNLYPGGSGGSVKAVIHNNNPYAIKVSGVAIRSANSDISADQGCTATFTFSAGSPTDVIAANSDSTVPVTLGTVQMGTDALNVCQGATITVPVTVTATQNS